MCIAGHTPCAHLSFLSDTEERWVVPERALTTLEQQIFCCALLNNI